MGKLCKWYEEKVSDLWRFAVDWPACAGGQYRIDDGLYVAEEDLARVLPSEKELNLWLLLSNLPDEPEWQEALNHLEDEAWLANAASASVDGDDAICYYTEADASDLAVGSD